MLKRLIAAYMILAIVPGPAVCCCTSRVAIANWLAVDGESQSFSSCPKCFVARKSIPPIVSTNATFCCLRAEQALTCDCHDQLTSADDETKCQCELHRATKYQQISKPAIELPSFPKVNQLDSWQLQFLFSSCYTLELDHRPSIDGIPDNQFPLPLSGRDLLRAYQILRC